MTNIIKSVVRAFQSSKPFPLNSSKSDWLIDDDGLVFYQKHCYVLDNLNLCRNIVHHYHDTLPTVHPGQLRTLALIQRGLACTPLFAIMSQDVPPVSNTR